MNNVFMYEPELGELRPDVPAFLRALNAWRSGPWTASDLLTAVALGEAQIPSSWSWKVSAISLGKRLAGLEGVAHDGIQISSTMHPNGVKLWSVAL